MTELGRDMVGGRGQFGLIRRVSKKEKARTGDELGMGRT